MENHVPESVYQTDDVCSIIPAHVLEGINQRRLRPPETLAAIQRTILFTENIRYSQEANLDPNPMPDRQRFFGNPGYGSSRWPRFRRSNLGYTSFWCTRFCEQHFVDCSTLLAPADCTVKDKYPKYARSCSEDTGYYGGAKVTAGSSST